MFHFPPPYSNWTLAQLHLPRGSLSITNTLIIFKQMRHRTRYIFTWVCKKFQGISKRVNWVIFMSSPPPRFCLRFKIFLIFWKKYFGRNLTRICELCVWITSLVTARKRSLGQGNIFTSVCHSVHGGGEYLAGTPPWQIHSPGRYSPPPDRYTPLGRYTSPGRYAPWTGTPPQTGIPPPRQVHPLDRYVPHGQVHPPLARYIPLGQVHPPSTGTPPPPRYGQRAGSTYPTGMQSCLPNTWNGMIISRTSFTNFEIHEHPITVFINFRGKSCLILLTDSPNTTSKKLGTPGPGFTMSSQS